MPAGEARACRARAPRGTIHRRGKNARFSTRLNLYVYHLGELKARYDGLRVSIGGSLVLGLSTVTRHVEGECCVDAVGDGVQEELAVEVARVQRREG
jgi:hypothetical protein